jgi:hypothetical protein
MCFDCLAISNHKSTNLTDLLDRSMKTFNVSMSIMNYDRFIAGDLMESLFVW